ncbi:MAG: DUF3822 family protein [Cytophagales bacterium]
MAELKNSKLINKIIDDTFEVDQLHNYTLSILLSSTSFQFCVIDVVKTRCMMLEHYQFEQTNSAKELLNVLKEVFEESNYLNAGFWKSIKLNIKNLKFSLVPNSLFAESYAKDILSVNCTVSDYEVLYYYKHTSNDTVNIFAAEQELIDWFKKIYPNKLVEVLHHTSTMMEGVLQYSTENEAKSVFVNIEDSIATIAVRDNNAMIFINNFKFTTPNDLLYFILFTYDELDLNTETIPMVLMGNIHKNSDYYSRIYKYIRNITFSRRPQGIKFGYKFDEITDHHYFGLYNTILC